MPLLIKIIIGLIAAGIAAAVAVPAVVGDDDPQKDAVVAPADPGQSARDSIPAPAPIVDEAPVEDESPVGNASWFDEDDDDGWDAPVRDPLPGTVLEDRSGGMAEALPF